MLQTDPSFADRFRSLPAAPGRRYFAEKALRDAALKEARRCARASSERAHGLVSAPGRSCLLPLRRPEVPGREMVLHMACLLPRESAAETIECFRALALREGSPLLDLAVTGPWPPFHFCPELPPQVG